MEPVEGVEQRALLPAVRMRSAPASTSGPAMDSAWGLEILCTVSDPKFLRTPTGKTSAPTPETVIHINVLITVDVIILSSALRHHCHRRRFLSLVCLFVCLLVVGFQRSVNSTGSPQDGQTVS